ncbi:response regulator [Flavobacteriaceae bacterium AU392]|nr:DNA-binding response regulator [Flavobacteriaceae bacterium]RKM85864.1 response regulator [Flavobacteriaceae bacterium AU392]
MKILIIEDEHSVAQNLCDILFEINPSIEIVAVLETVIDTVTWIENNNNPDLGFFDIQIADGNSFEIFERTSVNFPIVFTTAFDEFALKAFKVNSIDYLMKPIKKNALKIALKKYDAIYKKNDNEKLLKVIQELKSEAQKKYKKSFLVYIKDKILPIATEDIAYFYLENETVFCFTHKNERYNINQVLDKIYNQLDPEVFFRANRQYIVSRKTINSVSMYFHRKLKLEVIPKNNSEIIISKTKANEFKKWLAGD